MKSYETKYYFLGTDGVVDYYLTEPKANKTTITNHCELNVFEHDCITNDDGAIASMYYFGDDDIMSLEKFLSLKNDKLSKIDRITIYIFCIEINYMLDDDKVDANIIKNVLDKWKIVEEIFTKSNNKNSA